MGSQREGGVHFLSSTERTVSTRGVQRPRPPKGSKTPWQLRLPRFDAVSSNTVLTAPRGPETSELRHASPKPRPIVKEDQHPRRPNTHRPEYDSGVITHKGAIRQHTRWKRLPRAWFLEVHRLYRTRHIQPQLVAHDRIGWANCKIR